MTTRLPHGDEAVLHIRKLEDYCLSPSHPRGSDDQGRAYAVAPCPRADLLVLHYVPAAA